ncbi:DUF262 domain-containing protein [Hymenobacter ruricola]|uniref:DUF262 domain-containing protein n=1 Tax=Hymenobacter ruricola TaxID=2791023 RepID=A0ABS0I3X8_9BACT|nr:DUF262 domain-containing protein [Hymenobacter ruricola]MBF9221641.1 DUF262 domain-containing protein [Hymenobacter ruricola]
MNTKLTQTVDIQEVFKTDLKIEAKVMAIETLFANERRTRKTDYKPSYQRNYVWDDDKATYFIESILLGTEIPPIIFFSSEEKIEVIDGRQRYETIKRFIDKSFKLKKKGLLKLRDLKNKDFDDLGDLRDTFWDTKLRIIEFSFRDQSLSSPEKEEIVKKEIFKRYNSGITPLKSVEIDKAKYQNNDIVSFFKKRITNSKNAQKDIADVFHFEQPLDIEKALKKIRQQLVLPSIPIKYYANTSAKQEIIERFFEHLSTNAGDAEDVYVNFSKKLNYLKEIKNLFVTRGIATNRLIFECLFWAVSIMDAESISWGFLLEEKVKNRVVDFFSIHAESFKVQDSNLYTQVIERYDKTAQLFHDIANLDFDVYLSSGSAFKEQNRLLSQAQPTTDTSTLSKFESLRLNKPDASSNAIDDICTRMAKERFLLRPSYQRNEVIDRFKSSAIIESILLGIKLPPIFLYKRNDGVAEVLDGQQRLLSILGYLGRGFLDESKRTVKSLKNNYSLRRLNILKETLEGKKFADLPSSYQDRILDFDLWIIEISEKNNPDFDPIDLFIRLNYKPFPILENTFEMWNSYVDRDIIDKIKEMYTSHKGWFFVRRDNRRMDNEGLLTYLAFLEYSTKQQEGRREAPEIFYIYKANKINIRLKARSEITQVLDNPEEKSKFLESCENLERNFIKKVKALVSDSEEDENEEELRFELDSVFAISKLRSFQNFYILWLVLLNIPYDSVVVNKSEIRKDINRIMREARTEKDVASFLSDIRQFELKYQ